MSAHSGRTRRTEDAGQAPDTIFALSSGAGVAAVAVVRVSGPVAAEVLQVLAGRLPEPRQATLATLRDSKAGEVIDRGLILWFPAPKSFTGEDMFEAQVHGGVAVIADLFAALGRFAGVRPAEAGEFALRAFRNGKLDLLAAEGLADLLQAQTSRQRRQALHHVSGGARQVVDSWRRQLVAVLGRVAAMVDFTDEDGVATTAAGDLDRRMAGLEEEWQAALGAQVVARSVREGLRLVIAGPPNAGKSSLLNRLAERDAAIVSAQPGTTRDVIEVSTIIAGIPVTLCDTAGLRGDSDDAVEREGMARSRREAQAADILLWVTAPDCDEQECPPFFDSSPIRVANKADLCRDSESSLIRNDSVVSVSALTGAGMTALWDTIADLVRARAAEVGESTLVRERHRAALARALRALQSARRVSRETPELVAEELRVATTELGRITGAINVEDVLGDIFSSFCIGK